MAPSHLESRKNNVGSKQRCRSVNVCDKFFHPRNFLFPSSSSNRARDFFLLREIHKEIVQKKWIKSSVNFKEEKEICWRDLFGSPWRKKLLGTKVGSLTITFSLSRSLSPWKQQQCDGVESLDSLGQGTRGNGVRIICDHFASEFIANLARTSCALLCLLSCTADDPRKPAEYVCRETTWKVGIFYFTGNRMVKRASRGLSKQTFRGQHRLFLLASFFKSLGD